MTLTAKAQKEIFEGKCQDVTHCSLLSEMGECLFLSPVLYLCLAKDEVEEQAYYINSSCQKEHISPAKLWILEAGNYLLIMVACFLYPGSEQVWFYTLMLLLLTNPVFMTPILLLGYTATCLTSGHHTPSSLC